MNAVVIDLEKGDREMLISSLSGDIYHPYVTQ